MSDIDNLTPQDVDYWLNYYNLTGDEILTDNWKGGIYTARECAEFHVEEGLGHEEWVFEDVTEKLKYGELVRDMLTEYFGDIECTYEIARPPTPKPPTPMDRLQKLFELGQQSCSKNSSSGS